MSKRLDVLRAIKCLVASALPFSTVEGLDNDAPVPARPTPGGRAIIRSGDPGEPEVDLSPLAYNYEHSIPIELTAAQDTTGYSEEILDEMMTAIGRAIEADRTLGGLVTWLEASSPLTEDIYIATAPVEGRADLTIIATYVTSNPLT